VVQREKPASLPYSAGNGRGGVTSGTELRDMKFPHHPVIFTPITAQSYVVEFYYDPAIVTTIKEVVPADERMWYRHAKQWTVNKRWVGELVVALQDKGYETLVNEDTE
jgi:hypothetical protein